MNLLNNGFQPTLEADNPFFEYYTQGRSEPASFGVTERDRVNR
jgi:hypothetical protein